MNDESSKYQAVEGTIVNTRSNSVGGFHLEVDADMGFFVGQRVWISRTAPASQPAEQPRGDGSILRFAANVVELYDDATMRDDYMIDATEAAGVLRALGDSPYATHPKVATDAKPEQAAHDEALSRLVDLGRELKERDARAEVARWQAEYESLMARKPEQAVGDGVVAESTSMSDVVGDRLNDAITLLASFQSSFGSVKPDDDDEAAVWDRIDHAIVAIVRTIDYLATPRPAVATAGDGVAAWVTEDGDRAITAATKANMERDGGASAISVRAYSVPCYNSPSAPRVWVPEGWEVWRDGDSIKVSSPRGDVIGMLGHEFATRMFRDFCEAVLAAPPPRRAPRAGVPEYTTEMGEAGQKYIDSCVKNIQPQGFTLPALFRWHELFEAMLAAAPEVDRG